MHTQEDGHGKPHSKQEFHKSSVSMGSVLRSTMRMAAAGYLIDKLKLTDPMHRTLAFAAAGVGIGYVESLMRERKRDKEGRAHARAAYID